MNPGFDRTLTGSTSRLKGDMNIGPSVFFSAVFVALVGFFLLFATTSTAGELGGMNQWLSEIFKWNTEEGRMDYETARNSVTSLTCAINSVAIGSPWQSSGCLYSSTNPSSPLGNPFAGISTIGSITSKDYNDFVTGLATGTASSQETKPRTTVDCDTSPGGDFTCEVKNFQLPQDDIDDAKDRILKYGDPDFIVYWQSFPLEQVTWSYDWDWKLTAGIILLSTIPLTKIGGAALKVGFKAAAPNFVGAMGGSVLKKSRGWVIRQFASDLVPGLTKRLVKHPVRVAIRGVTVASAAIIAVEQSKSVLEKFVPEDNSLILKSPYEDKEINGLSDELKKKPVVLLWNNNIDVAHFVSPCYIESMKVSKETIKCNQYNFNSDEGTADCENIQRQSNGFVSRVIQAITGPEPDCDIETYIGLNNPPLTDIDAIKRTPSIDLIKTLRDSEEYTIWEPTAEGEIGPEPENENWKYLDCDEWTGPIRSIFEGNTIGGTVEADDGTKWYYWGDMDYGTSLPPPSNHTLWTTEDICGGKDIVHDASLIFNNMYWGKCDGDGDKARMDVWKDQGEMKDTFRTSKDLMRACLNYAPTGGVGEDDGIPHKIMITVGRRRKETLIDSNTDGYYESYSLKECKTTAVTISDVKRASTPGEYNYCFDDSGVMAKVISYAGYIAGGVGTVIACVVTGPGGWATAATILILGGAGAEIYAAHEEWSAKWPGEKSSIN